MSTVRSIKTTYAGVLFMSTLEADWAKNLDGFSPPIRWQYEPEGLTLPNGANYRCDFFLPLVSTWLEVKGPHNQRIDKPDRLAEAVAHAPGCDAGKPVSVFERNDGLAAASCACGFGDDFPYQFVVVGRPATLGKLTFESTHRAGVGRVVVLRCSTCQQYSFASTAHLPVCRRCRRSCHGSPAYPSGTLPFRKVEPPRGRPARRTTGTKR